MTYRVEVAGVPVPLEGAFEWRITPGFSPPLVVWELPADKVDAIVLAHAGEEVELRLHDLVVKRVVVLGNASSRSPLTQLLVLTDVRWYLTRGWLVKAANVRRRAGETRLVGDQPVEARDAVFDVQYSATSLNGTVPWDYPAWLRRNLDRVTRAVHGRPAISWVLDPPASGGGSDGTGVLVQEQLVDDAIPAGLARTVGALPGRDVYVDTDGVLHVYDRTPGAERRLVEALQPNRAALGFGHLRWVDMRASRPRLFRVLFTPELEVPLDFAPNSTVGANDPFLENVLRVTDPSLEITRGGRRITVSRGSYVTHAEAYTAWPAPTDAGPAMGALTDDLVRKWILGPGLWLNYVKRAVSDPDPAWEGRIAEVVETYRTLFRVNPKFWSRVLSARPVLASIADPENGIRAPSPIFSDYSRLPRTRALSAGHLEIGQIVLGYDARKKAPARLVLVDAEQGIFSVEWKLDPTTKAIAPSALEANPSLSTDATAAGIPRLWRDSALVASPRLSTVVSCVPAAPNDERRLFEVVVTVGEALDALGVAGDLPEHKGPEKAIRVRLTNARFALTNDDASRDFALNAFGAKDAVGLELADVGFLTSTTIKPVNLEEELRPLARATAAAELADLLDHYEGDLTVPLAKGVAPIGSVREVVHRVTRDAATTSVVAVGPSGTVDPYALLPASARKILFREVQS